MKIILEPKIHEIIDTLHQNDATCYIVGGFLRDKIINRNSYDIDLEIHNISEQKLCKVLNEFGNLKTTNFGVYMIDNIPNVEFALPRTETKIGKSHTEFEITKYETLDLKTAALRRDFTMNSLMYNLKTSQLIDNFNGKNDINNKVIKHISNKFSEDPLRILRAIRFSAELNFKIDKSTLKLCNTLVNELQYLSKERITSELKKTLAAKHLKSSLQYLNIYTNYFKIENPNFEKLTNTTCQHTRLAIFFYTCKSTNILKYLTLSNYETKFIKLVLNGDPLEIEYRYDLYNSAIKKSHLIKFYKAVINIDIHSELNAFTKLKEKYNGYYFLNKGIDKHHIKTAQKTKILNKLKKLG